MLLFKTRWRAPSPGPAGMCRLATARPDVDRGQEDAGRRRAAKTRGTE
jgi:hypothetical protein